ncbi:MAG: hypothetical protein MSS67_02310 [Helicobacter bilis]|uniref:hypothetical protein n=1 Tax=Helicobacter bilis TaxID=37372 RepID=UPI0026EB34D7|nr:hypothetical protein [Helicobacter bilis]MCI7410539.1 hypothetical protein [Helicobacter bilis]
MAMYMFSLYSEANKNIILCILWILLLFYAFILPLLIVRCNKIESIHYILSSTAFIFGLLVAYIISVLAFVMLLEPSIKYVYVLILCIIGSLLAGAFYNPLVLILIYCKEKNKKRYSLGKTIGIFVGSVSICGVILADIFMLNPFLLFYELNPFFGIGAR